MTRRTAAFRAILSAAAPALFMAEAALSAAAAEPGAVTLEVLGTYASGLYDKKAAEIVAYDPGSRTAFVTNHDAATLDRIDFSDPAAPKRIATIDMTPYGAGATSVAVLGGLVAAAVDRKDNSERGTVAFFTADGAPIKTVAVGFLPDMLTFTPDGGAILVANEGEPSDDYTRDPEGSVSIIDLSRGIDALGQNDVHEIGFGALTKGDLGPSVRIFGPNASIAQDLEPEYIAVGPDGKTAWVTLQENNAIAVIDIPARKLTAVKGLGFKDFSRSGNGLDPSDKDDGAFIGKYPVFGMYQPDAIAAFTSGGKTWLVTANEGDSRDYKGYSEEARVGKLALDRAAFPDADNLQMKENLGRLKVTTANGDADGDGRYEALYAFGARSFAVWDAEVNLVYDSGDALEQLTKKAHPKDFNADNKANGTFDKRSASKGPEPEGLTVAEIDGRPVAFIALERIGGVVTVDLADPRKPVIVAYVNNRRFDGDAEQGTAGDLGPESVVFVPAPASPDGSPMVLVGNEVSGTTTAYRVGTAAQQAAR